MFCLILFYLFCSIIRAQIFTNTFLADRVTDKKIISDENGFIYLLGYDPHFAAPDFNSTAENHLLIRKYDPIKGSLLWEKTLISPDYLRLTGVSFYNKKLFFGGGFRNQICFDNSCINSKGEEDLFYGVVSEDGNMTVQTEGGSGNEISFGFIMDISGNSYYAGSGSGVMTLGSKTHTVIAGRDPFLLKKDTSFNELGTLFGTTVKKPDESSWGTISDPKFYNSNLYFTFHGWHTMEGSKDTLGAPFGLLYRVDNKLQNYTPIYCISSGMYDWNDLEFVDQSDNYYYVSNFSYKTSGTSIVKSDRYFKTVWSYTVDSYYQMSHFVQKPDAYYYLKTRTDPVTGEKLFSLMKGELDKPKSYPLTQLHMGFNQTYIFNPSLQEYGKDLLVSGEFSDYLRIEDTLLYTTEKRIFISTIRFDQLTSLKENEREQVFARIYPNPVKEKLHFDLLGNVTEPQVFIYNSQGQLMGSLQPEGTSPSTVDLAGYAPGVYFVCIRNKDQVNRFKIVVQ